MPFGDVKRSNPGQDDTPDIRPGGSDAFRMRLASQQFLKHHGPLLRAYVSAGGRPESIAQRGVFEAKARQARDLAVAMTARVTGKPLAEVTLNEARVLRLEAADLVARAWQEGREVDLAALADDIASAVASADDAYDADTVAWSRVSGNGSATMTAAAVTLALAETVSIYDFRLGKSLVLSTLTSAVIEATRLAVDEMSIDSATVEDRRSLSQTTLRSFSGVMAQLYEDTARETLQRLVDLPEAKRRAWLQSKQPLEAVLGSFRTWTASIAAIAAAAARETMNNARSAEAAPAEQAKTT